MFITLLCITVFSFIQLFTYKARKIYFILAGFISWYCVLWFIKYLDSPIQPFLQIPFFVYALLTWGIIWLMLGYLHSLFNLGSVFQLIKNISFFAFFIFILAILLYYIIDSEIFKILSYCCLFFMIVFLLVSSTIKIIKDRSFKKQMYICGYLFFHGLFSLLIFLFFSVKGKYYIYESLINITTFIIFCFLHLSSLLKEDLRKFINKKVPIIAGIPNKADNSLFMSNIQKFDISVTEGRILQSILSGLENKNICNDQEISRACLKKHIESIIVKCGVKNRLEILYLFQD